MPLISHGGGGLRNAPLLRQFNALRTGAAHLIITMGFYKAPPRAVSKTYALSGT